MQHLPVPVPRKYLELSSHQPIRQYQYVSVPIPTTPQVSNTASTATPFILPIEANESHRGQSTVHWKGAAHIVSRSIEHW